MCSHRGITCTAGSEVIMCVRAGVVCSAHPSRRHQIQITVVTRNQWTRHTSEDDRRSVSAGLKNWNTSQTRCTAGIPDRETHGTWTFPACYKNCRTLKDIACDIGRPLLTFHSCDSCWPKWLAKHVGRCMHERSQCWPAALIATPQQLVCFRISAICHVSVIALRRLTHEQRSLPIQAAELGLDVLEERKRDAATKRLQAGRL